MHALPVGGSNDGQVVEVVPPVPLPELVLTAAVTVVEPPEPVELVLALLVAVSASDVAEFESFLVVPPQALSNQTPQAQATKVQIRAMMSSHPTHGTCQAAPRCAESPPHRARHRRCSADWLLNHAQPLDYARRRCSRGLR